MFDFMLTPEQLSLREEVRSFVRAVPKQLILDMDAERVHYPRGYLEMAAARNLLGLRFPTEFGGRGLNWSAEVVALEEIGTLSMSLGCLYSLVSIVGEAVNTFGTAEQKRHYLQQTLAGKLTNAEALTEPRGGSDFFGATTVAVRDGDHYILNGQKRFVVGAEGADYFMVYAKTNPTAKAHQSLSAFLVDRGEGVCTAHVYGLMGTRGGGAGRLVFENVRVPRENIIGEEHGASTIFYQMMIPERMTSAAGAIGLGRSALEVATQYTTRRKAFGKHIKDFQAVSFKVADSITDIDAARALMHATARAIDSGAPAAQCRRLVSEAKKFGTEAAWRVVNNAMQVMGGIGYTNVYPIERVVRDCRLAAIWTGSNEIMDLIIQHEYYQELAAARGGRDHEHDAIGSDFEGEKIYE